MSMYDSLFWLISPSPGLLSSLAPQGLDSMDPQRPSDLWFGWLRTIGPHAVVAPKTWVSRQLPTLLRKHGFHSPTQRHILEAAAAGLQELDEATQDLKLNLVHVLNLLWQPLIEYIDTLASGHEAEWTETLDRHVEALTAEMQGIVPSPGEALDFDLWVQLICQTLRDHLAVDVPHELVAHATSSVVPNPLPTTPAMAMILIRSSLCSRMVGASMAVQASRMTLSAIAEQPVALLADHQLKGCQELVALLAREVCPDVVEADASPAIKRRRDSLSTSQNLKDLTLQVWYCMKSKVSLTRARETISDAVTLVKMSHSSSKEFEETGVEDLMGRHALGKHILVLDGAMDRWGYERWTSLRERGLLAGCALATDESPPKQPRFRGLRFQISVLYVREFKPLHT